MRTSTSLKLPAFVGRIRELDILSDALSEVVNGSGQFIALGGEAGIGKTRLWQHFSDLNRDQGVEFLYGRSIRGTGTPPFWPWISALRDYVQRVSVDDLITHLGAGAAEIAEVMPQLRERLPGLRPPKDLGSAAESRFRIIDSFAAFIRNLSLVRPLAVMLDDLHFADSLSLQLLAHITGQMNSHTVLVVGAFCPERIDDSGTVRRYLSESMRTDLALQATIAGLSRDEVGEFVGRHGLQLVPDDLDTIHERTGGNPMFLSELIAVHSTDKRGEFNPNFEGSFELLSNLVTLRLEGLPASCERVLSAASILDSDFNPHLLSRLLPGLTKNVVFDAVRQLVDTGLLTEGQRQETHFRFKHGLIQDVVRARLRPSELSKFNGLALESLEETFGGKASANASALARHALAAHAVLEVDEMARWPVVAGENALSVFAAAEALDIFDDILARAEGQDISDEILGRINFGRGKALHDLGERKEASVALSESFGDFLRACAEDSAVEVALWPAGPDNTGSPQLVEEAMEVVSEGTHAHGLLLSHRAVHIAEIHGDYEGAQRLFRRAMEIAGDLGDRRLEMWALARSGHVDLYHARPRICLEKHAVAMRLNDEFRDPFLEVYAGACVVSASLCLGDPGTAMTQTMRMRHQSEAVGYRRGVLSALWNQAAIRAFTGDWDSSRLLVDQGLKLDPIGLGLNLTGLMLARLSGDHDGAVRFQETLDRICAKSPPGPITCLAVMAVLESAVDQGSTITSLSSAAHTILNTPAARIPAIRGFANVALSLAALAEENGEAAQARYADIEELATAYPFLDPVFVAPGRLLGLLASLNGEKQLARSWFKRSAEFLRDAGYQPELALTLFEHANSLPEDSEEYWGLLSAAKQIAERLGMDPLRKQIEKLAGSKPSKLGRLGGDPLTPRESEVLELVAQGLNNSEIGRRLFISTNTVRKHVSNVLAKLSLDNRTEAARFLLRQGLDHSGPAN